MNVKLDELRVAIKAALTCASKDLTRPHLNCVFFEVEDERLNVVAADGHRITRVSIPCDDFFEWPSGAIKRDEAERLVMNLKKQATDDAISITWKNGDLVAGRFGSFLRTREGDFPPYRRVIPSKKGKGGEAVPFCINALYMKEALATITGVYGKQVGVTLQPMIDPLQPVRLDADWMNIRTTIVIMPMRA